LRLSHGRRIAGHESGKPHADDGASLEPEAPAIECQGQG
jgi:hypothetical protein